MAQRSKRDERPQELQTMRLTQRDLDILQAVYDCRLLSSQQLASLFFSTLKQAYKRLALLYAHAYLERVFMGVQIAKMNTPILYVLDKRGAEILRAERGIEVIWRGNIKEVKPTFLEHALAINDVRAAFIKACEQPSDIRLVTWKGEQDLKADYDYVSIRLETGSIKKASVIPDSYFALQIPQGTTHFFLEQDMGTMDLGRFQQKILAYLAYATTGLSEKRFGTKLFRVLTVASSKQRAEGLKRITEKAGGESRFWFTHRELVKAHTVLDAPIWSVAGRDTLTTLIQV